MGSNRVLRIKFQKPGLERRPAAALQVVSRTCVIKVLCGSWDRSAEPWPRPAVLLSGSQLTFWPNLKFSSKKFRLAWSWEKSTRKYRISKHFQEFRSNVPSLLLYRKNNAKYGWEDGPKEERGYSWHISVMLQEVVRSSALFLPGSITPLLMLSGYTCPPQITGPTTSTLISLKKHHS